MCDKQSYRTISECKISKLAKSTKSPKPVSMEKRKAAHITIEDDFLSRYVR
jgi:hypothetical protein